MAFYYVYHGRCGLGLSRLNVMKETPKTLTVKEVRETGYLRQIRKSDPNLYTDFHEARQELVERLGTELRHYQEGMQKAQEKIREVMQMSEADTHIATEGDGV